MPTQELDDRQEAVRTHIEHMSAIPAKLATVAEGGSPHSRPHRVPIDEARVDDDYRRASRTAREGGRTTTC